MDPLRARESPSSPLSSAHSAHLSLVTVPRMATVETAGLAMTEAAVVTATASTGETAGETGAGPALLRAVLAASGGTATARARVASAGAGEAGSGGVLVARWALCGRRGLLPGPPPGQPHPKFHGGSSARPGSAPPGVVPPQSPTSLQNVSPPTPAEGRVGEQRPWDTRPLAATQGARLPSTCFQQARPRRPCGGRPGGRACAGVAGARAQATREPGGAGLVTVRAPGARGPAPAGGTGTGSFSQGRCLGVREPASPSGGGVPSPNSHGPTCPGLALATDPGARLSRGLEMSTL